MRKYRNSFIAILLVLGAALWALWPQAPQDGVVTSLYKSESKAPLLILLGGSEGGMWDGASYEAQDLIERGYNVLSVGYFKMPGISAQLNRINLDAFQGLIDAMQREPSVLPDCIGVIGGSKGAELALLLGSYYPDLHLVVGVTPSHVAFQASNITVFSNSSWQINGREIPYVPYPRLSRATLKGVLDGESYLDMHVLALNDKVAENSARIKVENINGPVLLISGEHDQMWPSKYMAEQVMERLSAHDFTHTAEHVAWDTDHYILDDPLAWQHVANFVDRSFADCGL